MFGGGYADFRTGQPRLAGKGCPGAGKAVNERLLFFKIVLQYVGMNKKRPEIVAGEFGDWEGILYEDLV